MMPLISQLNDASKTVAAILTTAGVMLGFLAYGKLPARIEKVAAVTAQHDSTTTAADKRLLEEVERGNRTQRATLCVLAHEDTPIRCVLKYEQK